MTENGLNVKQSHDTRCFYFAKTVQHWWDIECQTALNVLCEPLCVCVFTWLLRHCKSQCPSTWTSKWFTGTDGANNSIKPEDAAYCTSGGTWHWQRIIWMIHTELTATILQSKTSYWSNTAEHTAVHRTHLSQCSTLSSPPSAVWLQTCPVLGVGGGQNPAHKHKGGQKIGSLYRCDVTSCSCRDGRCLHTPLPEERRVRRQKSNFTKLIVHIDSAHVYKVN